MRPTVRGVPPTGIGSLTGLTDVIASLPDRNRLLGFLADVAMMFDSSTIDHFRLAGPRMNTPRIDPMRPPVLESSKSPIVSP